MRLNEILIEQQLDEKPQGFLSRMANKAKSFVPGSTGAKAKGNLEVGKEANWLITQFDTFMGKVGGKPTPQTVIDFLRKNNYPTGDAEKEMTKMTKGQKIGAAVGTAAGAAAKGIGKVVGGIAKGVSDVAKGAMAGGKDANANTNTQQPTNTQQTTAQDQEKPQPAPTNNIAIKGQKGKKIVPPSQQNKTMQAASIDWSNAEFIFEDGEVTLSRGQLDNIFMAAVRQAVARDEGGQADTGTGVAPADAQGGGIGGAFKAAGQAAKDQFAEPGSTLPPELKKQLEQLPARDKQQLMKML